jgi:2-dehydro-3-deoxygalactonokinase
LVALFYHAQSSCEWVAGKKSYNSDRLVYRVAKICLGHRLSLLADGCASRHCAIADAEGNQSGQQQGGALGSRAQVSLEWEHWNLTETIAWIAVDWGTSNLRAWGIDANGGVVASASSDQGMGKLKAEQFPIALTAVVKELAPPSGALDVVVCGMAGARQGWLEAPYLEAPTDLATLGRGAVHPAVPNSPLNVSILPGVCQREGAENVMRGEETQLLGLASVSPGYGGLVCMPGTHSKWARLDGTRIESFTTAMTGEMFDLLKTHSVLRHSLAGELDGPERETGFQVGARAGLDHPEALLGQLFRVRASALLSGRTPDWCAGYLSGLLIGTEIAANRHQIGTDPVPLIGSPVLCGLYAKVLAMTGATGRIVDSTEVVLAGLKAARASIA